MPVFDAQDPAASGEFYGEVLGLEVVMDHGWIITFAAPDNPAAQISLMTEDASAPVQPDASIEVETWTPHTPQLGVWAMRSCTR